MTTVIRTRMPLETLKMSQQPTGRTRSRRPPSGSLSGAFCMTRTDKGVAYDEEDGDFMFTRAAKRAKTTRNAPESAPTPQTATSAKRAKLVKERDEDGTATVKKARVKKQDALISNAEADSISVPARRRSARLSGGKTQDEGRSSRAPVAETTELDAVDLVGEIVIDESHKSLVDASKHSTLITLPFSDTPIINRNKELRKKGTGARRSSLGMRGRRASSLIESGHSALPHREVDTPDFYKHIEAEGLSEPRRMKQLLTWVGERALGDKPSHGKDSAAELAARVIKEQLLKDFGNKSEFSDWFNREDIVPQTKIITQPNPTNIQSEQRIVDLEARIKKLKAERDQWKALSKSSPSLPPILSLETTSITPSQINASLLDPEQAAILESLTKTSADSLRSNVQARLQSLYTGLEFKVDRFADGVHKIEQYQQTVGRVADKILRVCAGRLEERDRKEKEAVGTRDVPIQEVLRSLSRILPEGNHR